MDESSSCGIVLKVRFIGSHGAVRKRFEHRVAQVIRRWFGGFFATGDYHIITRCMIYRDPKKQSCLFIRVTALLCLDIRDVDCSSSLLQYCPFEPKSTTIPATKFLSLICHTKDFAVPSVYALNPAIVVQARSKGREYVPRPNQRG